jgi:hypothetical protein
MRALNCSAQWPHWAADAGLARIIYRSEKKTRRLAVASAAAFAATTASATTTAGSAASRLRFIDPNRAALDVPSVQAFDRAFRRIIGRHLDETETSRAISRAVDDDLRAVHLSCF